MGRLLSRRGLLSSGGLLRVFGRPEWFRVLPYRGSAWSAAVSLTTLGCWRRVEGQPPAHHAHMGSGRVMYSVASLGELVPELPEELIPSLHSAARRMYLVGAVQLLECADGSRA